MSKNEIQCNNEILRSIHHKIDCMAYGLQRDHPPAWEVKTEKL